MTDEATAPKGQKKFEEITLEEPITRGETTIEKVTVRKPGAGELRGLSLQDLLTSDVDTILKVLPRVTDPILAAHEVDALDPADLGQFGGALRGFFMTKSEREALMKMMNAPS